jgi:general secretion pathway protein G
MKRKGFTLIELIVVIAIIAVLAAIVAPGAFRAIDKGKVSATIGDFKSIKTAAMAYYADTGQWPGNTTNGTGFINNNSGTAPNGWDGPYLEKWPAKSQWGGVYSYSLDTAGGFRNLTVTNVTGSDAIRVDIQVDGSDGSNNGSVQWTMANGTAGNLTMILSKDN